MSPLSQSRSQSKAILDTGNKFIGPSLFHDSFEPGTQELLGDSLYLSLTPPRFVVTHSVPGTSPHAEDTWEGKGTGKRPCFSVGDFVVAETGTRSKETNPQPESETVGRVKLRKHIFSETCFYREKASSTSTTYTDASRKVRPANKNEAFLLQSGTDVLKRIIKSQFATPDLVAHTCDPSTKVRQEEGMLEAVCALQSLSPNTTTGQGDSQSPAVQT